MPNKPKIRPLIFYPDKIKELRELRGLSCQGLANITKEIDPKGKGVSRSMVSRLETKGRIPSVESLGLIAAALRTRNMNQFWKVGEESSALKNA